MRSIWRIFQVSPFNIFLLLSGGAFVFESWRVWTTAKKLEFFGPGGLSLFFSLFWVIGTVALIIIEILKGQRVSRQRINMKDRGVLRGLAMICLIFIWCGIVGVIQFTAASVILLISLMIIFGATKKRDLAWSILVGLVVPIILYFIFTKVFNLPLPGVV